MGILYEEVFGEPSEEKMRLRPFMALAPALMKKVWGTEVPFVDYRTLALKYITFPGDIVGIYAYQAVAATVSYAVRNAFLAGNLEDLNSVLGYNGVQLKYMRISWNEEDVGTGMRITDLVVGAVVQVVSPTDICGDRIVKALTYVSWYRDMISQLSMPWKVYLLLKPERAMAFNRWVWEARSDAYQLSSLTGFPSPPPVSEVKSHFLSDGAVDSAIGKFVTNMLDNGYTITLLPYGYKIDIAYETIRTWIHADRQYAEYRTHTRLTMDFTSVPEVYITGSPFVLTPVFAALIVKLAWVIAIALVAYVFLKGLVTQTESYEKYGWVYNPDTGKYEWKLIEKGEKVGAPEWLGTAVTFGIVALAVIVGVSLIPRRRK